MRVAIYSPYLDTAGGGEKYILTIAETLSQNHQVDVLLDSHLQTLNVGDIVKRNEKLHGLRLSEVRFIPAPIGKDSYFWKRFFFLRRYDYLFTNTDGSLYFSTAKNSIIHFQVPFENTTCKSLWGKIKLSSWKMVIYNSSFTKEIIEKTWPISGKVVYPPVSIELFAPLEKKKQIVSVGRFSAALRDKKHELMIEAFKKLVQIGVKGWSLHLAGGANAGDLPYLEELKKIASGYEIFFYPDADLDQLKDLYGHSSIYWHAKGYEEEDPKATEHFGITTVEAMAGGCVPVVINKGGQPEIVEQGKSGFLWNSLEELEKYTMELIKNEELRKEISERAVERSKIFSKVKFEESIKDIVR